MPDADKTFRQVPGLYRLWDLQFVLNHVDDYHLHYAEMTEAGVPLYAVYRRRVEEAGS